LPAAGLNYNTLKQYKTYTAVLIKNKFCTRVVWLKARDPTKIQARTWMCVSAVSALIWLNCKNCKSVLLFLNKNS